MNRKKISIWLMENDLFLNDLAMYLEVSPSTLWRQIEGKVKLRPIFVLALAHVMDCAPEELLSNDSKRNWKPRKLKAA